MSETGHHGEQKVRQTLYRWPHRNVEDDGTNSYLETAETPPLELVWKCWPEIWPERSPNRPFPANLPVIKLLKTKLRLAVRHYGREEGRQFDPGQVHHHSQRFSSQFPRDPRGSYPRFLRGEDPKYSSGHRVFGGATFPRTQQSGIAAFDPSAYPSRLEHDFLTGCVIHGGRKASPSSFKEVEGWRRGVTKATRREREITFMQMNEDRHLIL